MIRFLECAVDDLTYKRVSALCGEDTAFNLCYTDEETSRAARSLVDGILSHPPPEVMPNELGRHPRTFNPSA